AGANGWRPAWQMSEQQHLSIVTSRNYELLANDCTFSATSGLLPLLPRAIDCRPFFAVHKAGPKALRLCTMSSAHLGVASHREIFMRVLSSVARFAALSLGLAVSASALAFSGEEGQLIDSINAYRSQAQPCGGEASLELPPLNSDTRLALSPEGTRDLQQAMTRAAYPMVNVQAISLSGPRDARAAMGAIEESFC